MVQRQQQGSRLPFLGNKPNRACFVQNLSSAQTCQAASPKNFLPLKPLRRLHPACTSWMLTSLGSARIAILYKLRRLADTAANLVGQWASQVALQLTSPGFSTRHSIQANDMHIMPRACLRVQSRFSSVQLLLETVGPGLSGLAPLMLSQVAGSPAPP